MIKLIKLLLVVGIILSITCCEGEKPNQPPILLVSANPSSGRAPLTVNFTASAQDPEGGTLTYNWNFGDGSGISSQQNPVYTYTAYGEYTATCTATDSGKPALMATATVNIEALSDIPTLSSVLPVSAVMHMPSFTLTVTGNNFQEGAAIVFNGVSKSTTYVNSKKLTCTIAPDDTLIQSILEQGDADVPDVQVAFKVTAKNPDPSGGESNSLNFLVNSNYSFEDPVQLPNASESYSYPAITIRSDDQLNVVYRNGIACSECKYLKHILSNDKGDNWTTDMEIVNNLNDMSEYSVWDPRRALFAITTGQNNTIYVAYTGPPDEGEGSKVSDLYLAFSNDGSTWTKTCLTCNDALIHGAYNPSLGISDGDLLIYVTSLIEEGTTYYHRPYLVHHDPDWSSPLIYNEYDTNLKIGLFTVDAQSRLHFAVYYNPWYSPSSYRIAHFSAERGAIGLSNVHFITYADGGDPSLDLISDPNGILYVFWACPDQDNRTLRFNKSDDGGITWYKSRLISGAGIYDKVSSATDSAGNLIVVFSKQNYGYEKVYFHRSIDGGQTWSAPKKVADPDGKSGRQAFAIDSTGRLHVVWKTPDSSKMYYSRSKIGLY